MIHRYQWNIFKTLEFLNSRKEDTEVDSVFFQQLNVLHAKLQDRGMIHSKQWVVMPGMNEEEIILTNTFLNSKNKNGNIQRVVNRRKKKTKTLNWKENIAL